MSTPDPTADRKVTRHVVGWREYVALPDWGIPAVKTKVDTGARTSALDVANIDDLGDDRVRFEVVTRRLEPEERVVVETDVVRRTRVKSSFGATHERLIVQTRMQLGEIEKTIELSLVCRKNMLCRMLLGRKALAPDLIVDSSQRYLHGRKPRKPRKPKAPPS
jgi:hypothetical protein